MVDYPVVHSMDSNFSYFKRKLSSIRSSRLQRRLTIFVRLDFRSSRFSFVSIFTASPTISFVTIRKENTTHIPYFLFVRELSKHTFSFICDRVLQQIYSTCTCRITAKVAVAVVIQKSVSSVASCRNLFIVSPLSSRVAS
jgi:hypothetical protein